MSQQRPNPQFPYEYHPNFDPINILGTPEYEAHQEYLRQQAQEEAVRRQREPWRYLPTPEARDERRDRRPHPGPLRGWLLSVLLAMNHGTVMQVAGTFYVGVALCLAALIFLAVREIVERHRERR
jgi:hypothetical protein